MRSSTRKADRVRAPLLVLPLVLLALGACTAAASDAVAPLEDHRMDAGEHQRAMVYAVADHRLDQVERQRGGAFLE